MLYIANSDQPDITMKKQFKYILYSCKLQMLSKQYLFCGGLLSHWQLLCLI